MKLLCYLSTSHSEVALPMLALLLVFWIFRGITNALLKTSTVALQLGLLLKLVPCYPVQRGRAEVDHGCWYENQALMGRTIGLQKGLKSVNAQPEKLLHVSHTQASHSGEALFHLQPMHARYTNIESGKTTSIHKVRLKDAVSSLGNGPRFVSQTTMICTIFLVKPAYSPS